MILIVTGSRTWTDRSRLDSVLTGIHSITPIDILVHGACPTGADLMADDWAEANKVSVLPFPAEWKLLGKMAGQVRNGLMADFGKACQGSGRVVLVKAFRAKGPSPGTDGMCAMAEERGLQVSVEREDYDRLADE